MNFINNVQIKTVTEKTKIGVYGDYVGWKNPHSTFFSGVLISAQPLEDGKMFEVCIEEKVDKWNGSVIIGCTTSRPEAVSLSKMLMDPSPIFGFVQDSWIFLYPLLFAKHGRNPGIPLGYGHGIVVGHWI